jgi:hypothetical protein
VLLRQTVRSRSIITHSPCCARRESGPEKDVTITQMISWRSIPTYRSFHLDVPVVGTVRAATAPNLEHPSDCQPNHADHHERNGQEQEETAREEQLDKNVHRASSRAA